MGSSRVLEFLVALVVGVLAVLGALLCIGFLLVEPIRSPPSEQPTISLADVFRSPDCPISLEERPLPVSCTLDGQTRVSMGTCSSEVCTCPDNDLVEEGEVCCCRQTTTELLQGLNCTVLSMNVPMFNVTSCGCASCSDIEITIMLTVVAMTRSEPIPAAQVYREEESGRTSIGITNNRGMFVYRVRAGARNITLSVQSPEYMPRSTGILNLNPASRTISQRLVLMPRMNVPMGMGDSALSLRLGSRLAVSASSGTFMEPDGSEYEGLVAFGGTFAEATDNNADEAIPSSNFRYFENGTERQFSILSVMNLRFTDDAGRPLGLGKSLVISVSLPSSDAEYCIFLYNQANDTWTKSVTLTPSGQIPFRKKRQLNLQFDGEFVSLDVLAALATLNNVECWLQTRGFGMDGVTPASNTRITIRQMLNDNGLLRITGQTSQAQTSTNGLPSNAICLPLVCNNVREGSLRAEEADAGGNMGMSLVPVEFDSSVFNDNETAPVVISTVFSFLDVMVTATPTRPLPFYPDRGSCESRAEISNPVPADYFAFAERDNIVTVTPNDFCFAKVQILSCNSDSVVTVTSIVGGDVTQQTIPVSELPMQTTEPITTTSPETTSPETTRPDPITSDFIEEAGSGTEPTEPVTTTVVNEVDPTSQDATTPDTTMPEITMPPPETTGPFVCNADTATLFAACIPFRCGGTALIMVSSGSQTCELTARSTLLENTFFPSPPPNSNTQLVLETENLIFTNYNDPDLGLYADLGSNPMASTTAMERCNAGTGGNATSAILNPNLGRAAEFSCF